MLFEQFIDTNRPGLLEIVTECVVGETTAEVITFIDLELGVVACRFLVAEIDIDVNLIIEKRAGIESELLTNEIGTGILELPRAGTNKDGILV